VADALSRTHRTEPHCTRIDCMAKAFELRTEVQLAPSAQQHAIQDVLRLLATWAARGARAQETGDETDPKGAKR
jgi:hypothetical protein